MVANRTPRAASPFSQTHFVIRLTPSGTPPGGDSHGVIAHTISTRKFPAKITGGPVRSYLLVGGSPQELLLPGAYADSFEQRSDVWVSWGTEDKALRRRVDRCRRELPETFLEKPLPKSAMAHLMYDDVYHRVAAGFRRWLRLRSTRDTTLRRRAQLSLLNDFLRDWDRVVWQGCGDGFSVTISARRRAAIVVNVLDREDPHVGVGGGTRPAFQGPESLTIAIIAEALSLSRKTVEEATDLVRANLAAMNRS